MSDTEEIHPPEKKPGALQTNLGSAIVGGTIAGMILVVMTPFIATPINAAITDQGVLPTALTILFYALAFGIPFAVIAFLVISVINPRARQKVWGWLIKWGPSLNTAKQRQVAIDDAAAKAFEEGRRAGMKRGIALAAEKTKPLIASQIEKVKAATRERDALQKELDSALTTLKHRSQAPSVGPALPPLEPRWTLIEQDVEENGEYGERYRRWKLLNLVDGSVAYNVRVEASPENRMDHSDGAAWKDLSGKAWGTFGGNVTDRGATEGFTLQVSWLNQDGENRGKDFWISASEEADVWATADATPF